MILIEGAKIYAPKPLGKGSILIFPPKIVKVSRQIDKKIVEKLGGEIVEGDGMIAIPGFIDQHVHINGAGGEGGPQYRTPPISFEELIKAGITSVIGLLGTDGVSRSLRELLMKCKGLRREGISSWIYTGSYQIPSPTITGSVLSDIVLIEEVIGVKISLSDHRSSHPMMEELLKVSSEAHVASVLTGKAGVVHIHIGNEKSRLNPLLEIIEETEIPIERFAPTHLNRSEEVLEAAIEFGKKGGYVDLTTGMPPEYKRMGVLEASEAIKILKRRGVDLSRITMSSDGNGSMPRFDDRGRVTRVEVGRVEMTMMQFRKILKERILKVEEAIKVVSTNVAEHLNLYGKGRVEEGFDADILLLDDDSLELRYVIANGEIIMRDEKLVRGSAIDVRRG